MIGDLPFANIRPPENILFVCKLNPVTQDEDLELIFSRFGKILSCEVIRDKKTGDSLQYAFIEFDERESAEMVRSWFPFFYRLGKGLKRNPPPLSGQHQTDLIPSLSSQAYFKMQNVLVDDRRIWVDLYVLPLLPPSLVSSSFSTDQSTTILNEQLTIRFQNQRRVFS